MNVAGKHSLAVRGDDFYASPPEAVRALLAIEREHMPMSLWEPACGDGAIVLPLRAAGYQVVASDLVARGCPDSTAGVDFLMPFPVPSEVFGIVTNPPFKLAHRFVSKALTLVPYVALLLRVAFLEGSSRQAMFETTPLARVHISSRRLPMMHRHGWKGPLANSSVAHAWFIWDRRHHGWPELRWFDWRDFP